MDLFEQVQHSRTFRHLCSRFNLGAKKVLDVGSSEGHYLANFGPGSVGVTIIKEHVAEAASRGLNVVLKNVEDPTFAMDQTFEVVWANNFFEHMNAPHLFVTKMRDQLNEDGVMILGVPVIPFFSFLTRFRKFRGAYAASHVNYFTRQTLIDTVRAGGWEVQEARAFYFSSSLLDSLLNPIAPHLYIIATPTKGFTYAHKRLLSLEGYH